MGLLSKIKKEGKVLQGKATKDKTYSSKRVYPDTETATGEFKESKIKLFDVNGWSEMPGISSKFELYDSNGIPVNRNVQEGDFIRILLPAPVPENWVLVTAVNDGEHSAEFTVSPSEHPRKKNEGIKHFFIKEATSTFKVILEDKTLHSFEIGKNEGINNEGLEAADRELINTLVAAGGWAAFQKIQWENLTDYLVNKEETQE